MTIFSNVNSVIKLPKIFLVSSVAILVGYPIYYIIKESPKTVHKNIIKKIQTNLVNDDYIHLNSLRISKEVRKVLNYPAKDVSIGINGLIEQKSNLKMKLSNKVHVLNGNIAFIQDLKQRVDVQQRMLDGLELDID